MLLEEDLYLSHSGEICNVFVYTFVADLVK